MCCLSSCSILEFEMSCEAVSGPLATLDLSSSPPPPREKLTFKSCLSNRFFCLVSKLEESVLEGGADRGELPVADDALFPPTRLLLLMLLLLLLSVDCLGCTASPTCSSVSSMTEWDAMMTGRSRLPGAGLNTLDLVLTLTYPPPSLGLCPSSMRRR